MKTLRGSRSDKKRKKAHLFSCFAQRVAMERRRKKSLNNARNTLIKLKVIYETHFHQLYNFHNKRNALPTDSQSGSQLTALLMECVWMLLYAWWRDAVALLSLWYVLLCMFYALCFLTEDTTTGSGSKMWPSTTDRLTEWVIDWKLHQCWSFPHWLLLFQNDLAQTQHVVLPKKHNNLQNISINTNI